MKQNENSGNYRVEKVQNSQEAGQLREYWYGEPTQDVHVRDLCMEAVPVMFRTKQLLQPLQLLQTGTTKQKQWEQIFNSIYGLLNSFQGL